MSKNEFLDYYHSAEKKKKIDSYNFQLQFIERLNQVHRNIFSSITIISKLLKTTTQSTYVYGLPGGGKTYVANTYLDFLKKKQLDHLVLRVHFQEFMTMMHAQVDKLRLEKVSNPLDIIGKKLSKKYKLICFDELEIVDIADAMIVSKLFTSLLKKIYHLLLHQITSQISYINLACKESNFYPL